MSISPAQLCPWTKCGVHIRHKRALLARYLFCLCLDLGFLLLSLPDFCVVVVVVVVVAAAAAAVWKVSEGSFSIGLSSFASFLVSSSPPPSPCLAAGVWGVSEDPSLV